MGAKTLLHLGTAQPGRLDAMVLVSATPYFPQALRTAAEQFTRESFAHVLDLVDFAPMLVHFFQERQIVRFRRSWYPTSE
jgi:hypothetical protein